MSLCNQTKFGKCLLTKCLRVFHESTDYIFVFYNRFFHVPAETHIIDKTV